MQKDFVKGGNKSILIENIIKRLKDNKQIVLYGPPGTGKTHLAKRIAVAILTGNDPGDENIKQSFEDLQYDDKAEIVQFHPSYSYEDFIQGIKPVTKNGKISYKLYDGIFKKMCHTAEESAAWVDYEAKVAKYEEIKHPIPYKLIKHPINQYGITKIDKNTFEKLVKEIKSKGQELEIFNDSKIKNYFFLTTSERLRERDDPKRFYRFGRGSGYKQLTDALNEGKVACFFYEKGRGGFYEAAILDGLVEHKEFDYKILVIDEINRGNLSKIFGELFYALEYRDEEVRLQYSQFSDDYNGILKIPGSLLIIGTMNTADRSVSLFDTALRRRFAFVPIMPDFDIVLEKAGIPTGLSDEQLKEKLDSDNTPKKKIILSVLAAKKINENLIRDIRQGREKQIGHTYFLKIIENEDHYLNVWKYQIIPLLEEFYSSNFDKLKSILGERIIDEQKGILDFDENDLTELLKSIIGS